MTSPARVRMYRQGLGDCFLVSFPRGRGTFHMLIDCGALNSKHYDATLMKKVVSNIHKDTDGKLDVIALTHEHWDHISGFSQAEDLFKKFEVGEVWTAWTEEPHNRAAAVLKREFKKRKEAVAKALAQIPQGVAHPRLSGYRHAIEELVGFSAGLGAAGANLTSTAWQSALGLGESRYCDPKKTPIALEGLDGVRFYILGPPEDPDYIRRKLSKRETYDSDVGFSMFDSFMMGVDRFDDPQGSERARPFDKEHCLPPGAAMQLQFFKDTYGEPSDPASAWRRIDHDWLGMTGQLALHLDSYTNNTCLAFAIELVDSGRVLLFPGDAQVGNWLSWGELSWSVSDDRGTNRRKVDVVDLLARTVLYKVGHHGSHNATLREKGLEKMTSPDLVALIPVHRKTAEDQAWEFPHPPLWQRLKEKARGRVLLADAPGIDEVAADARGRLTKKEWSAFRKQVKFTDLYVEYSVSA